MVVSGRESTARSSKRYALEVPLLSNCKFFMEYTNPYCVLNSMCIYVYYNTVIKLFKYGGTKMLSLSCSNQILGNNNGFNFE
jgi:hypothetical protein